MAELITVPTFIFEQGDIFDGGEFPIQVCYNNGSDIGSCIELMQDGKSIIINYPYLKKLCKEIEKHHETAQRCLKQ